MTRHEQDIKLRDTGKDIQSLVNSIIYSVNLSHQNTVTLAQATFDKIIIDLEGLDRAIK